VENKILLPQGSDTSVGAQILRVRLKVQEASIEEEAIAAVGDIDGKAEGGRRGQCGR